MILLIVSYYLSIILFVGCKNSVVVWDVEYLGYNGSIDVVGFEFVC